MKNSSDTVGNRTWDLAAWCAVPQPTAPPRGPKGYYWLTWTCEKEIVTFWCKELLLPVVKLWDCYSSILIIRYGLRIMSLWGWGVEAGRGSSWGSAAGRRPSRESIARSIVAGTPPPPSATPRLRPPSSSHYAHRAVWGVQSLLRLIHVLIHGFFALIA
jgi:hypothetical protein